jgi:hypothetical protein
MKKLTLLFLGVGLFLYLGESSHAQRGQGAGKAPAIGQTRGPAQAPGAGTAQTRSQGRANAGIENIDRGAAQAEAGRGRRGGAAENGRSAARRPEMKVAGALERNPQLSSRLEQLLPSGMNLTDAAAGFRNRGQFIAALHVSKNLDLPFQDVKARMTGDNRMSLGEAVHDLRPDIAEDQAKAEAKRAEAQGKAAENQAKADAKKAATEARAAAKGQS